MSLKKMTAEGLFLLSSVVNKIGMKNIISSFTDSSVKALVSVNADNNTVGAAVLDNLMLKSFDKLFLCKDELIGLISQKTDKKKNEIKNTEADRFFNCIAEIIAELLPDIKADDKDEKVLEASAEILESFIPSEV